MEILMTASEMVPFAKTGGLADVVGALPLALAERGEKVSVFIPCYRGIEAKFKLESTGISVTVPILNGEEMVDKLGEVLKFELAERVTVYLLKMDEYYDREALYSLPDGDYPDNCARFTFFCRGLLEFLKAKNFRPDVIHCHDWQAALIPIYLKTILKDDPFLGGLPVITTIHNLGYPGLFWYLDMKLIGVPWDYFTIHYLEYYGKLNLLKGALVFSDLITTVSKGYAREIQTEENGGGLDAVIRTRQDDLFGIVNGIDYQVWNPETDPHLAAKYSPANLRGKAADKAALQKELSMTVDPKVPIVGCISRLVDQKGFDLIAAVMERMMAADLQFVLLGNGDRKYHEFFAEIAEKYPERTGITIAYNDGLAHRIEAGADLFLMPSLYEPCGLNQLISLKYGTVPVVRATGGLDDTVSPWKAKTGKGNGFKFDEYTADALWASLAEALACYRRPREWKALIQNGMAEDHSWNASAAEYIKLYKKLGPKKKTAPAKKTARPAKAKPKAKAKAEAGDLSAS